MASESEKSKKNIHCLYLTHLISGFILKFMKIIKKYFLKQLFAIFIMLLLILTGLAWMLQLMSMMKFLITYGINIGSFLGLSVLMIPFIISIIIPFVTFISIIFIYNKLIADNEITVMSSSGMSPFQIARPALRLAFILAIIHWVLNLWIVPISQTKFYDTQWELRYGLAHMKLQESSFTRMTDGLVVYVDKVSDHDLSQIMLSDKRNKKTEMTIFAETGKLISTNRGLSIIMNNGSLQYISDNFTIGTFDNFDMDLNIEDKEMESIFKVRKIPTYELFKIIINKTDLDRQKLMISEIATRLLNPIMNLILAGVCVLILLGSSLLRRRTSLAPIIAVGSMAALMGGFMSGVNIITSITGLILLGTVQLIILLLIMVKLLKK